MNCRETIKSQRRVRYIAVQALLYLGKPAHSKRYGGNAQASRTAPREDGINGGLRCNVDSLLECVTVIGWLQLLPKGASSPRKK